MREAISLALKGPLHALAFASSVLFNATIAAFGPMIMIMAYRGLEFEVRLILSILLFTIVAILVSIWDLFQINKQLSKGLQNKESESFWSLFKLFSSHTWLP